MANCLSISNPSHNSFEVHMLSKGLLGAILIALTSTSIQAQKAPEYFRHLTFRESAFAPYKGIHPINAEQAKGAAHYRFEYDDKDRVKMLSHQIGDELIADNGNWDTFIWFSPKVTIEYGKGKETHRYFNVDNVASEVHGKVYRAEYKLNAENQRVSMHLFDKEGQPSLNAWGSNHYTWSTDSEGRITEKRYDLNGKQVAIRPGFDFYEIRLDYDKNGLLMFMTNYGLDGKITNNESGAAIDRIYYDQEGNFQRWSVFDKERNPIEGNIPMVHIGEHLYDKHGNKVGMRGFNRYGEPINFSWGPFSVKKGYDKFANQNQVVNFSKPDVVFNTTNFEYTKDGLKRQWMKFVDTSGELISSPRLGGAAALEFHYEKGSKVATGRSRYNEELKPFVATGENSK